MPETDKINLETSARLAICGCFRDGGTIFVAFESKDRKTALVFRLRSFLKAPGAKCRPLDIVVGFKGAFEVKEMYTLDLGGAQEKALLEYLNAWLEKNVPADKLAKLKGLEKIEDVEARSQEYAALTEKDWQIHWLLGVTEVLSERR